MRQSYIAAIVLVAAAACRPGAVAPHGSLRGATREAFERIAASTAPTMREVLRLAWRSDDGRISIAGSGAARIQPPDSLRLDVAVRLGVGRATLILAGDSVRAEPQELVAAVLPDRATVWSVFGVVRVPEDLVSVELLEDGERSFWRVTDARGRHTTYELQGGRLAGVVRESQGRETGRLRLRRDAEGRVVRGSVTDALRGARFEIEVTARETSEPFAPEIWQIRR